MLLGRGDLVCQSVSSEGVAVATEMAEVARIYQGKKHCFPKEKFVSIYLCNLKEVKYFGGL